VLVPEYAADVDDALAGVIYGATLILVMYVERRGAVGLAKRIWTRITRRPEPRPEREQEAGEIPATGVPSRGT
jgi:hypothetical protein